MWSLPGIGDRSFCVQVLTVRRIEIKNMIEMNKNHGSCWFNRWILGIGSCTSSFSEEVEERVASVQYVTMIVFVSPVFTSPCDFPTHGVCVSWI